MRLGWLSSGLRASGSEGTGSLWTTKRERPGVGVTSKMFSGPFERGRKREASVPERVRAGTDQGMIE